MWEANLQERCNTERLLAGSSSPTERMPAGGRGPVRTLAQHLHAFGFLKCPWLVSVGVLAGWRRAALQRALLPSHQTQATFWPQQRRGLASREHPGPPPVPNPASPTPALPSSGAAAAWLKGPLCLPQEAGSPDGSG